MSEELVLMDRQTLEETLSPTEGLTHKDIQVGLESGIRFHQDGDGNHILSIKGEDFSLGSGGLRDVARVTHIPKSYTEVCPTSLLFQNLNYWYTGGMHGRVRLFLHQGQVVGATTNRTDYYSNLQMVDKIQNVVGEGNILGYHQVHTSLGSSRVAAVVNRSYEVHQGDVLFGGVEFQNSIVGESRPEITPYIFRQWCSNGEIVAEKLNSWSHRDDGKRDFGDWVDHSTREALDCLDREFGRIQKLTEQAFDGHITEALESIFTKFMIPVRTQKQILDQLATTNDGEGPKTMYDLWNAVTYVGTHSTKVSTSSRRVLQKVAGEITQQSSRCPSCHQLVIGDDHSHSSQ